MARSSITGADKAPTQAEGRDVEALGPSDSESRQCRDAAYGLIRIRTTRCVWRTYGPC